jgi:hypothetical protein
MYKVSMIWTMLRLTRSRVLHWYEYGYKAKKKVQILNTCSQDWIE